jgi:O-antigen ligase
VLRWGLAAITILAAFLIGAVPLIWPSPNALVYVAGGLIGATLAIILIQHPLWALALAITTLWLPDSDVFGSASAYFFDAALAVATLAWIFQVITKRRPLVWEPTSILAIGLVAWCCVTLAWAPDMLIARRGLVSISLSLIMLILIVNQIDTLEDLDVVMRGLALGGWIMLIGGLWTVLTTSYRIGDRLKVWNINENMLGMLLIPTLIGVLWSVMRAPIGAKRLRMLISIIFLGLISAIVTFTGSRGSSSALFLILAAFLFLRPTQAWGRASVILVVVAALFAPYLFSSVTNRLLDPQEDSLGSRPMLWEASMLLIRDHPWGGAGVGNGSRALLPYIRMITDEYGLRTDLPSHNPFLEVTIDTGLFGGVVYVAMLVSAGWSFVRRYVQLARAGITVLNPYFAVVACTFIGYISAWVKSGGTAVHLSYFMLIALLVVPQCLKDHSLPASFART